MSKSEAFSNSSANSCNISATMELRIVLAGPIDIEEATIRNSNLLPVNAKGDVRFLSVASLEKLGRV